MKGIYMRIEFSILILSGLVLAGAPGRTVAADLQGESTVLEQCGAFSEAGMRDCLATKVAASSAALQRAEDQTFVALSKWDEDAKYVVSAQGKLRASSKAFAQYREAQCAFTSSLGGGAIGNALEIRRLACVAGLNAVRAQQLDANAVSLKSK